MKTLQEIVETFANSGWEVLSRPAQKWLDGDHDLEALRRAVEQADRECGSCGCELDPLYKRCLHQLKLLDYVAPCALFCYTCMGYCDGGFKHYAERLYELHRGCYEGRARVYGSHPTEEQKEKLAAADHFNRMLLKLQQADCPGCRRSEGSYRGCISGCVVPQCVKEHRVLYCAECPEFPCKRNDGVFQPNVMKKWLEGNTFLRDYGLEAYFEKGKQVSHYIEWECTQK